MAVTRGEGERSGAVLRRQRLVSGLSQQEPEGRALLERSTAALRRQEARHPDQHVRNLPCPLPQ